MPLFARRTGIVQWKRQAQRVHSWERGLKPTVEHFGINGNITIMPELSRFFGIIIRMYMEAGVQHHTPHFHAYYQDDVAVYGINPVELISGNLPKRQQRLVEAWAELHQHELAEDWQRLQAGQAPQPIAPLG